MTVSTFTSTKPREGRRSPLIKVTALYIGRNSNVVAKLRQLGFAHLEVASTVTNAVPKLKDREPRDFVFVDERIAGSLKKTVKAMRSVWRLNAIHYVLIGENLPNFGAESIEDYGYKDVISIHSADRIIEHRLLHHISSKPSHTATQFGKIGRSKRIFDIVFASGAILMLSPVLLLTALAIRLESKGPIVYRSKRVGQNYRIFGFLKFRSMYPDADQRLEAMMAQNQYAEPEPQEKKAPKSKLDCPNCINGICQFQMLADSAIPCELQVVTEQEKAQEQAFVKFKNDPRITKVGQVIRKTSIDELPQLFNILAGHMSIVGNRPIPLYEAEKLTTDEAVERFKGPAGLTGLWQIKKRGKGEMSAEERRQLDIEYARNHSFWGDIKIILGTIPALFQKENV